MISTESPLGKALMGRRVGDRIDVNVNESYSYRVELRSIEKTGEEASDHIRRF